VDGENIKSFHFISAAVKLILRNCVKRYTAFKGTVQQKLTGVLSGINRKLMISSIAAGYLKKNLRALSL
jgi:hypothetical protein